MDLEREKVKSVELNYEHIKTDSFSLEKKSEFALQTGEDLEVKAVFNIYLGDTSAYGESSYQEGEDVRLTIYDETKTLVFTDSCYHTGGFKFTAKKSHSYLLRFETQGRRKLISMTMVNYLSHRKDSEKLHT